MISSLKIQNSTSTKSEPYLSFLSNEPLYIQYLVWKASEDMSNHPGHVSDHALTPIASLSDLIPEDNKANSRESEYLQSGEPPIEGEGELNKTLVPEEPMATEVIEQIVQTILPEVEAIIQSDDLDIKPDSIEEIQIKSDSKLNDTIDANSIVQEETEKVENVLISHLPEEAVPSSRIIIQKIPEKSRVFNIQRYQPIHRELLSPVRSEIRSDAEPIQLSPFSRWLRSTVNGVNDETSKSTLSTEYLGEEEFDQKSIRDKSKSPKKMEIERVISDSVRDHTYLVTEQYADLLHTQGYLERAINIYGKLMEKYPEKSSIFATKIQEINKEIV